MASHDEVLAVTGYEIETVSPFGLPTSLPLYLDSSLVDLETVYLGCGVKGYDIEVDVAELIRALQPKLVSLSN